MHYRRPCTISAYKLQTQLFMHTFSHGHGSLLPLLLCLVPHVLSHLNGTVAHLLRRIIIWGYGAFRVQLYMVSTLCKLMMKTAITLKL